MKAADCVLIPVQPSPYDIWATSDLVDLVKQRIELTDGKLKAAFVVPGDQGHQDWRGSHRGADRLRPADPANAHHAARHLPEQRGQRHHGH
jgi:hypothetical protein